MERPRVCARCSRSPMSEGIAMRPGGSGARSWGTPGSSANDEFPMTLERPSATITLFA